MIQTLFDKPTARIKVNGDLTAPLTQHKGCRQGCAVSFFLFAIFIKHRNEKVFNHHGKPQLALFADDVFFFLYIYLEQPTQSLSKLMCCLEVFGRLSIQRNKSSDLIMNPLGISLKNCKFTHDQCWTSSKLKTYCM